MLAPTPFIRLLWLVVLVVCAGVLVSGLLVVADLYAFELQPLALLAGRSGLLVTLGLIAGTGVLLMRAALGVLGRRPRRAAWVNVALLLWSLLVLWVLQYLFLEVPLTLRTTARTPAAWSAAMPPPEQADFAAFSLARSARGLDERSRLAIMYERIRVNNPESYRVHPIGATIDRVAARTSIDPTLLFFRTYLNSYYGEAVSGPVPFMRAMTSETIRDVVQVHLPAWFVESALRRQLASSDILNRVFGETLGFKLRYAIQKATLDVSTQPYDSSTFSDVFLVLQEYPAEFADVLDPGVADPVGVALRDSFQVLRGNALRKPYELPYAHPAYSGDYYARQRSALKTFARAAFYRTALDFDFATRVQAMLSTYQRDHYQQRLGAEKWQQLPAWQQLAMLAMIRDVYTPNVGRLAYNAYALPELNCTPVEFVASQASADAEALRFDMPALWRPEQHEFLWAGAAYQLRVLGEIWLLTHAYPIPGLPAEETTEAARALLARLR